MVLASNSDHKNANENNNFFDELCSHFEIERVSASKMINSNTKKRAAVRGGLWSTDGKRAEKYLMLTLCKLYTPSPDNYNSEHFVKDKSVEVFEFFE